MWRKSQLLLVLGVVFLNAAPPPAQAAVRWEASHTVDGDVVSVENLYGDVLVRLNPRDRLDVIANGQGLAPEAERWALVWDAKSGALRTRVSPESSAAEGLGIATNARVDLTVLVPNRALVSVRTAKGRIEARALPANSKVVARTVEGAVSVRTAGTLEVESESGTIDAVLLSPDWPSPPKLRSTHGRIRVLFHPTTRAEVLAATHGLIATDYSVEVKKEPLSRWKQARALLGGGGPTVEVSSVNGAIELLQWIATPAPAGEDRDD